MFVEVSSIGKGTQHHAPWGLCRLCSPQIQRLVPIKGPWLMKLILPRFRPSREVDNKQRRMVSLLHGVGFTAYLPTSLRKCLTLIYVVSRSVSADMVEY